MNAARVLQRTSQQRPFSWQTRIFAVAIVMAFHGLAYAVWTQHGAAHSRHAEMSISFEMAAPQQPPAARALPTPQPVQKIEPVPVKAETPVAPAPVETEASPVAATTEAAPVLAAITEPDYKASYLNNTPPAYPLAARRMGMQGRVLLQVEVLSSGQSGQIAVQQSSGYAMLDAAAMNAVKRWRFAPATQAGQAVDKWFIIPIQFSLKESSA